jgi:hypothetical protein
MVQIGPEVEVLQAAQTSNVPPCRHQPRFRPNPVVLLLLGPIEDGLSPQNVAWLLKISSSFKVSLSKCAGSTRKFPEPFWEGMGKDNPDNQRFVVMS